MFLLILALLLDPTEPIVYIGLCNPSVTLRQVLLMFQFYRGRLSKVKELAQGQGPGFEHRTLFSGTTKLCKRPSQVFM